jgi:hypothetical protein
LDPWHQKLIQIIFSVVFAIPRNKAEISVGEFLNDASTAE